MANRDHLVEKTSTANRASGQTLNDSSTGFESHLSDIPVPSKDERLLIVVAELSRR